MLVCVHVYLACLFAHRYYSLQLWFPEFFKQLHLDSNSTTVIQKYNESRVNHLQFYQDSLFTALASLPGNIAGALLINIIGARIQTGDKCSTCFD